MLCVFHWKVVLILLRGIIYETNTLQWFLMKVIKNLIACSKLLEDDMKVGKFKVQFSAGEDVKVACGMFI